MEDRRGVAILVGAGDAIGAIVARRFAEGGYTICICRREAAKSRGLVEELKAAGHGERFTSADTLLTTCLDWAINDGIGIATTRAPISSASTSAPPTRAAPPRTFRSRRSCPLLPKPAQAEIQFDWLDDPKLRPGLLCR